MLQFLVLVDKKKPIFWKPLENTFVSQESHIIIITDDDVFDMVVDD